VTLADELAGCDATALVELVRTRELKPEELTLAAIVRAERDTPH
jgi:hypothetical protein